MADYDWGTDWNSIEPTYSGSIDVGAYPVGDNFGGGYDSMNLSADDPASPYYKPPYNPASGINPYSFPSGSGMYDVGQGWQEIQAPASPQPYSSGIVSNQPGINPKIVSWSDSYAKGRPSYMADFNGPAYKEMASWGGSTSGPVGGGGAPRGGGGGGGGGQSLQRVSLGQPERTLYDRYSGLLQNPEGMATDPAYKFLFNQGMQAFNRTAAMKGMRLSGNTLLGAQEYGQGRAYDYMNKMLPQYQAGAREELSRFMGPAGLLPGYTNLNNRASGEEGASSAAGELLPYYQRMLEQSMGGGGSYSGGYGMPQVPSGPSQPTGWGAGYGGVTPGGQGYRDTPARLEEAFGTTYPETVNYDFLNRPEWGG